MSWIQEVFGYFVRNVMPSNPQGMRFNWSFRFKATGMGIYQYFTDKEMHGLQDSTCQKLSIARRMSGVPFIITSGLRTKSENDALAQSAKDSAHLTGNGVDLACTDSATRFLMLKG